MRPTFRIGCLCGLIFVATLQAQSTLPPGTWRADDAPAELHSYISRADLLLLSLQASLRQELDNALSQGGPAFAINSCHIDLAGFSARLGKQSHVALGRTSDRLRNPANAAPPWAAPLVSAYAGHSTKEIQGFAVDLGDAVGVLRPIAQREMCNACHGTAETLDPAARAAITSRYPADRATGFKEGDIRGWFWAEVPKNLR